jgi:chromosomal replication initiation ATPase DnaA
MGASGQRMSEADQHRVQALVASAFAVGSETIRAPSRGSAEAAFARQVAMYLARTRLGLSLTATGAFFGRDRTTAAHACRLVEEKREDPRIDAIVDVLERAIDVWPEPARKPRACL